MNASLLDRLRSFRVLQSCPIVPDQFMVARLEGVDFKGILDSSEFGFTQPFDVKFGKMMIRAGTHLLGGDTCGRYAFIEQLELSLVLDRENVAVRWTDALDLQNYLVAIASSKMSLQIEDEAIFTCTLYSFSKRELAIAYLAWRQQEAYLTALDRYCAHVLSLTNQNSESVAKLMEGLGPLEKEEILRQNEIEYNDLPTWQRRGSSVHLARGADRVTMDTNLPQDSNYQEYLIQHLD